MCPYCRTLNHLTADRCFHPDCGETLSLLLNFGECYAALQRRLTAKHSPRLQWRLRLQSPLGAMTLDRSPDQLLPTTLPGWPGSLEWSCDGCAAIAVQGAERCLQALPAEFAIEETRLRIWCEPELPTGSVDRPLRPQPVGNWPMSVGAISIGRLEKNDIVIPDPLVNENHALVWQMGATPSEPAWIVDCGTVSGTFVNRRQIDVTPLEDGDFVQIVSVGFVYHAADQKLQRVSPLTGARLSLQDVTLNLPQATQPLSLTIAPGEFVVFRGESGAGKSTLAKAIVGQPGRRRAGTITLSVDGHHWCMGRDAEQCRQHIGYVPQDSIVHEELSVEQAWQHLSRLRLAMAPAVGADELFGRLGLAHEVLSRPIEKLSGGENKRVRTALELLHQPGLLVLDEPDSGLDAERQRQLFRMLRGLAYQGCTLIVVTHAPCDVLDYADRIIALDQAAAAFDGKPRAYREWLRAGCPSLSFAGSTSIERDHAFPADTMPLLTPGFWRQSGELLQREIALWRASCWAIFSRLILPVGIVPCLFAAALGLSVPSDQAGLLGFLAILSVIWMSASLSVGAISGERSIFDHERLLFLTTSPYLAAKMTAIGLLSVLQTTVFFATLTGLRWILQRDYLLGSLTTLAVLIMTGGAAVALGLLLSTIAGHRREVGAALLPFVILLQLVCSVAVVKNVNDSYEGTYGDFHVSPRQPTAENSATSHSANRLVAALSHLTLSRPADEALRSYAYNSSDYAQRESPTTRQRFRRSLLWLGFMGGAYLLAAGWILNGRLSLTQWRRQG